MAVLRKQTTSFVVSLAAFHKTIIFLLLLLLLSRLPHRLIMLLLRQRCRGIRTCWLYIHQETPKLPFTLHSHLSQGRGQGSRQKISLELAASAQHSSWGGCSTQGLGSPSGTEKRSLLVKERTFLDHAVMNRSRAMFMHQMIQFGPIQ
ncbi:hypothetical protein MUK42_11064 [Musa troglodytarum]|uniref:Uncharacterized protein n=1 Tax=Musa troglodytarum TaxID=320322 RepID=A0A9E7HQQ1_9LILI|nr:hypothetical protein MUK42_11064 [Musa troglodytarum]